MRVNPVTLTPIVAASTDGSRVGLYHPVPEQQSRISMPSISSTSRQKRSTALSAVTSRAIVSTFPGCSFFKVSSRSRRRAAAPTRQPMRAKSEAIRRPMPDDAPMTIIFFMKVFLMLILSQVFCLINIVVADLVQASTVERNCVDY